MIPFIFGGTEALCLKIKRLIVLVVISAFTVTSINTSAFAQVAMFMPPPGRMIHQTASFEPPQMIGLKVDLKDPFSFSFIMDEGQKSMPIDVQRREFNKIIKYFLASLTTTNKDMWVNLSPYESKRIIPPGFSQTEMGRDLLAQDYVLKQFTASLIYPEAGLGKEFWKRIYQEAQERFGTTAIPIDTFNKVWIVADKADIYQKGDMAFLVGSHLKVMLEQDFMATEKHKEQFGNAEALENLNKDARRQMASNLVREIIIPAIQKEVNEGSNFAAVRQIYSAEIMATWFKKTLRESLLGQVYADKGKNKGIMVNDLKAKEKIYLQYLKAYKKGVFNYIREDLTPDGQTIPRKYFSGGAVPVSFAMINTRPSRKEVQGFEKGLALKARMAASLGRIRIAWVQVSFLAATALGGLVGCSTPHHNAIPAYFAAPRPVVVQVQENVNVVVVPRVRVTVARPTTFEFDDVNAYGTLMPGPNPLPLLHIVNNFSDYLKSDLRPFILGLTVAEKEGAEKSKSLQWQIEDLQDKVSSLKWQLARLQALERLHQFESQTEKENHEREIQDFRNAVIREIGGVLAIIGILAAYFHNRLKRQENRLRQFETQLQDQRNQLDQTAMTPDNARRIFSKLSSQINETTGLTTSIRIHTIPLLIDSNNDKSRDLIVARAIASAELGSDFYSLPDTDERIIQLAKEIEGVRSVEREGWEGYGVYLKSRLDKIMENEISRLRSDQKILREYVSSGGHKGTKKFFNSVRNAINKHQDKAQVGGINLSDEHLTLNIKVDGAGMPMPAQYQNKAMVNLVGLTPEIRSITLLTPAQIPQLFRLAGQK